MKKFRCVLGVVLPLLIAGCALAQEAAPPATAPASETGYRTIFDGKSMEGWRMAGPGEFILQDDGSMMARGGMGLLWYTPEQYRDFVLKLEWKAAKPTSNSGVFVRFPDPGNDPWIAVNQGYEIQIHDSSEGRSGTGSIYSFEAATARPMKPSGEWNEMEIMVVGQHYVVLVNGVKVTEYEGSRSREGYAGVQNHGDSDQVFFRNIRVKRLRDNAPEKPGS
jgi:hypothetical protein